MDLAYTCNVNHCIYPIHDRVEDANLGEIFDDHEVEL